MISQAYLKLMFLILSYATNYSQGYVKPSNIVGGQYISISHAPWQLSLQVRPEQQVCSLSGGRIQCKWRIGEWTHICGASLVDSMWAVTGKHCVDDLADPDKPWESLRVVAGITYIVESGTASRVQAVHFNRSSTDDFALLRLQTPIGDSLPFIHSIRIASASQNFENQWCYTTGWGKTINDKVSSTLKGAWVYLRRDDYLDCVLYYGVIAPWNICVQNSLQHDTACQGDSGGPLVCYIDKVPLLVGATYKAVTGCPGGTPFLYTRISHFLPYIQDTINDYNI